MVHMQTLITSAWTYTGLVFIKTWLYALSACLRYYAVAITDGKNTLCCADTPRGFSTTVVICRSVL